MVFPCPHCRRKLRIKSAYAHLRGKCCECGRRIEPLKEAPFQPLPLGGADEPMGLVPIEEEWPEPAQPAEEEDEAPGGYGVSAAPRRALAAKPEDEDEPAATGYGVHRDRARPAPKREKEPEADPYAVAPSEKNKQPDYYPVDEAPLPKRAEQPPFRPLALDVCAFPLQPECQRIWITLALFCSLTALGFPAQVFLTKAFEGSPILGYLIFLPLFAGISFATLVYGCNRYLAVLEDTAGGNELFHYAGAVGLDGFFRFGYFMWISAWSMGPFWLVAHNLLGMEPEDPATWAVVFGPSVLLFPLIMLCTLSAGSPWTLLEPTTLRNLGRNPRAAIYLYAHSIALMLVAIGALAFISFWPNFVWAPVVGFVWSTCALVHARVMGKVGWQLTNGSVAVTPTQKTKTKAPPPPPDDDDEDFY